MLLVGRFNATRDRRNVGITRRIRAMPTQGIRNRRLDPAVTTTDPIPFLLDWFDVANQ